jgi:hypothetical protein
MARSKAMPLDISFFSTIDNVSEVVFNEICYVIGYAIGYPSRMSLGMPLGMPMAMSLGMPLAMPLAMSLHMPLTAPSGILVILWRKKKKKNGLPKIVAYLTLLEPKYTWYC